MKINSIVIEDFVNYKKPSMFIGMGTCTWKCCKESNIPITVCQNHELINNAKDVDVTSIIEAYKNNSITEALVIGGLEPFDTFSDLLTLVDAFRQSCSDDIVIYTGYYPYEISNYLTHLCEYKNIIIKFGRFIPDNNPHRDDVLGVDLISDNQYAVKLNTDAKDIIKAMGENNGYCPCMIKQTADTLCCCKAFRNKKSGTCHCGIFSK